MNTREQTASDNLSEQARRELLDLENNLPRTEVSISPYVSDRITGIYSFINELFTKQTRTSDFLKRSQKYSILASEWPLFIGPFPMTLVFKEIHCLTFESGEIKHGRVTTEFDPDALVDYSRLVSSPITEGQLITYYRDGEYPRMVRNFASLTRRQIVHKIRKEL